MHRARTGDHGTYTCRIDNAVPFPDFKFCFTGSDVCDGAQSSNA